MTKAQQRPSDTTTELFLERFEKNLYYQRGQAIQSASLNDKYTALAYTIRDYLIDRWRKTVDIYYQENPKFVYYLSAEYLLGGQLSQNLLYSEMAEIARQSLAEQGEPFDQLVAQDVEPGLGNGGLGRLAACFMDSLATLDIPSVGYGLRYEYGIFTQAFKEGWQVESADQWLSLGNPWEFPQPDNMVEVKFGGYTHHYTDENGRYRVEWRPGQTIFGQPYHLMVPGYKTNTVNMLRLWQAKASKEFDFQLFDIGNYAQAVEQKTYSENITKVLYPNDNSIQGQELRLKQQYFFVACSLQDIIRRFHLRNDNLAVFPDKVVIQLNDTHPVIAIPELMRLLVDDYLLGWEEAWLITQNTFAYTCHTLLPEALERWPVRLIERLLPRHLEIIYEINRRFLTEVQSQVPHDPGRMRHLSIIEDGGELVVRMANLAAIGSFSINGVAELHSNLLRERVLRDFYDLWPEKFNNKTNGVTPRRFMKLANPGLSDLITAKLGEGWLTDLDRLQALEAYLEDEEFRQAWQQVKLANKQALADDILKQQGITVNSHSLFDMMVKRLHEYKRQHLKALHIITLYNRLKANPELDIVPRTFIFGAKAAPGYFMAKRIIRLLNGIAEVVNQDPVVRDRLKVIFLANFNVALAQRVYPAAELSEQISLAGKEASGTGNMKFALNGAITVGTLDGANIEIRERVGPENFFLFGLTAEEVFALKEQGYNPLDYYHHQADLKQALDQIASGYFSRGDSDLFRPLIDALLYRDEYMALVDYQAFLECQDEVDRVYRDQKRWTQMSILNVARCGFFSSDRTIRQYCEEIWRVKPVRVGS